MTRLPDLERAFPRLVSVEYSKSSDQDLGYNCIAWAAEDNTKIWTDDPAHYWPPGATRGWDVDALTSAFSQLGYSVCSDGGPEAGYEKMAIYADDSGEWQHACARWPTVSGPAKWERKEKTSSTRTQPMLAARSTGKLSDT